MHCTFYHVRLKDVSLQPVMKCPGPISRVIALFPSHLITTVVVWGTFRPTHPLKSIQTCQSFTPSRRFVLYVKLCWRAHYLHAVHCPARLCKSLAPLSGWEHVFECAYGAGTRGRYINTNVWSCRRGFAAEQFASVLLCMQASACAFQRNCR